MRLYRSTNRKAQGQRAAPTCFPSEWVPTCFPCPTPGICYRSSFCVLWRLLNSTVGLRHHHFFWHAGWFCPVHSPLSSVLRPQWMICSFNLTLANLYYLISFPFSCPPFHLSLGSHHIAQAGLAYNVVKNDFGLLTLLTSFPSSRIKKECPRACLPNFMSTLLFIPRETPDTLPLVTGTTMYKS